MHLIFLCVWCLSVCTSVRECPSTHVHLKTRGSHRLEFLNLFFTLKQNEFTPWPSHPSVQPIQLRLPATSLLFSSLLRTTMKSPIPSYHILFLFYDPLGFTRATCTGIGVEPSTQSMATSCQQHQGLPVLRKSVIVTVSYWAGQPSSGGMSVLLAHP